MGIFNYFNKTAKVELEQQKEIVNKVLRVSNPPLAHIDNNSRIKNLLGVGQESDGLFKVNTDQNLSVFEQAYRFFKQVYGLEDIKRSLYLNLISESFTGVNTLLVGAPATAKSLFMNVIKEQCNDVVYFDMGTGTTAAGLINRLKENLNAKIIIIDEIDKAKKEVQNVLLGLLENGEINKDLKGDRIHFKMSSKIFATTNSNKATNPFLSRFTVLHLPEYTDSEFIDVVAYCLNGKIENLTSILIAQILLRHKMKNIRLAIRISKMVDKRLTDEEIITVVEDIIKRSIIDKIVDYN